MLILISILAAFLQASKDIIAKNLSKDISPYTLSVGVSIGMVISNSLILFLFPPDFKSFLFDINFYSALFLTVFLFAISSISMSTAFKISDLSLVIPILNFSTLFTLILQPLFGFDLPNSMSILGIFIIIVGSYFLKLDIRKNSFLDPIKSLFFDKGAVLMLVVAFVWALDNFLGRTGTQQTNPIFWTLVTSLGTFLLLLIPAIKADENFFKDLTKNFAMLAFSGILTSFSSNLIYYLFITNDPSSLSIVSSLLRTAGLFSVLYGMIVLKEKQAGIRIIALIIMIIGVFVISFSGV